MLKINILHLLVALAAVGAFVSLRREAGGRSLTAGQLLVAPALAFATAFLLLAMSDPAMRKPALWAGGLAAGLLAGSARGILLPLQVDRMWDRLRLPQTRDGLGAAGLLIVLALTTFGAALGPHDLPMNAVLQIVASTAAAACAGFLAGRAGLLWLRTWNAPHSCLRRP